LGLPLWLSVRRSVGLAVSRSDGDFDLDDLIPLLIGAISLWYGEKFTKPPTRVLRNWIVHADIMTHTAAAVQQACTCR
ncbi:MAG TPA: hypothetical protein PLL14_07145, partial [Accumulibacter sp.]|nr:hypothetical protein [Accumulibacter sp.]